MKKAVLQKIISVLAALVMAVGCAMPAFAREIDTNRLSLEIKNAPEGTATIEILVPAEGDDCLCETHDMTVKKIISHSTYGTVNGYSHSQSTDKENKDIVISKDSEIAQYVDEDGYISLCAHTDGIVETVLNVIAYDDSKTEKNNGRYLQIVDKNAASLADIDDLEKRFGKFKAAYIDEKGNILGVTDEFEIVRADGQYAFKADGNKLTLVMDNYGDTVKGALFMEKGLPVITIIAVIAVVLAVLVVIAIVITICSSKKNDKLMQDDEL